MPSVGIVGASKDRAKFGNKALRAHQERGWDVHPVHPTLENVEGVPAVSTIAQLPEALDRITLYVPPQVGITLLDAIAQRQPKELFLNPGTSSPELISEAKALGLNVVTGCAILNIGESPSDY